MTEELICYRPWRCCARLALEDLWHDFRTTWTLVFTISAILAPLLLLFGLKVGVIGALRTELLQDPKTLEIVVYGNNRLERTWFESYQGRPEVGFLVPKTRTINATLDLMKNATRFLQALEIVPTAVGDPLLARGTKVPQMPSEILITETAARKLDLGASPKLQGIIKRHGEHALVDLQVIGIVAESRFGRDAIFGTLDLLVCAEDYRDGLRDDLAVDTDCKGISTGRGHFNNARIYAADLDAVSVLANAMRSEGVEIRTQANRIDAVRALDRVLSFVFSVIAMIGSLGGAVALGGALWVNVDRKRRDMALVRLFGVDNRSVVLIPAIQALAIAALGFLLAYAFYAVGSEAFNRVLGTYLAGQGYLCRLSAVHLVIAAAGCLTTSLIGAIAGAHRASRIDPAECLRET